MNKLPDYIDCKNKNIEVCPYYMHELCKETCAYAKDIRGLGIGACCDGGLIKRMRDEQTKTIRLHI